MGMSSANICNITDVGLYKIYLRYFLVNRFSDLKKSRDTSERDGIVIII